MNLEISKWIWSRKILSLNLEENQVSNFTKEFQDLGFEIIERL